MAEPVASPCVRQCTLDAGDVCLGCFRTLTEITAWSALDSAGRRQVLAAAEARRRERPGA